MPSHSGIGCGSLKRRLPVGGSAYGMPRNAKTSRTPFSPMSAELMWLPLRPHEGVRWTTDSIFRIEIKNRRPHGRQEQANSVPTVSQDDDDDDDANVAVSAVCCNRHAVNDGIPCSTRCEYPYMLATIYGSVAQSLILHARTVWSVGSTFDVRSGPVRFGLVDRRGRMVPGHVDRFHRTGRPRPQVLLGNKSHRKDLV